MKHKLAFVLYLLCAIVPLGYTDTSLKLEVGVDTWFHLTVNNGEMLFVGEVNGVSSHRDLKRWPRYYSASPTARIFVSNHAPVTWDMLTPLPLNTFVSGVSRLEIRSVKLLASGRNEVSMHPGVINLKESPPGKKECFIAWNRREVKINDEDNGASPYCIQIVLAPNNAKSARKATQDAYVSTKHRILPSTPSASTVSLDKLAFSKEIGIAQLHRNNISQLPIQNKPLLFDFQDSTHLFAQSWGKTKHRLIEDKFSIVNQPIMEISTNYTPNGCLRSMDFILYSIDESLSLQQNAFFALADDVRTAIQAKVSFPIEHKKYSFKAGDKGQLAKWEIWKWSNGDKLIELNVGHEFIPPRNKLGRYIFIRITPRNVTEKTRLASFDALRHNVEKQADGSTVVKNIPMVNQGQKGYCNDAILTSVLLYMGLDVNQYSVNLYLCNFTTIGSFLKYQKLPLQYYRVKMKSPPRDEIAKKYNFQKHKTKLPAITEKDLYERASDMKKNADYQLLQSICKTNRIFSDFRDNLHKYINRGVPIIWGICGHVRMIIGYNSITNEIIYRDSWGKDHVAKRMDMTEAFISTNEFLIIEPKH